MHEGQARSTLKGVVCAQHTRLTLRGVVGNRKGTYILIVHTRNFDRLALPFV